MVNDSHEDTYRAADDRRFAEFDRRDFLKASGVAGAAGLTGFAGCMGGGGDDTLTFGAIHLLSGFAAVYGESAQLGYEMAREEINENGGIDGSEIGEIVYRDSEGDGPTGVEAARSLVQEENVDGLLGLDSSGVALSVAPVIEQLQTPFMITHAATPFATATEGENAVGNDYVFRDGVNLAQNVYGSAVTASDTDATTWTTIGPNYAFGTQTWDYFKAFTQGMDLGYEYLDDATAYPELGASDFTPYINKVLNADPDGVITSLWGGDLITFINQAKNSNFFERIDNVLMTVGAATDVLRPMGNNMPDGLQAGTRYWFDAPDTEANNTFVENFRDRNDGRYPSYNAQNAYTALYLYKNAIEGAGSTNADDIIDQWDGMQYNAPVGEFTINSQSNQAVLPAVWGTTSYSEERGITLLDPVERIDAPADELRSLLEGTDLPAGV
ncbi:ABC transporter substrate-binding protein [Salarchaeum japonicum]|uniref:ABC transporter substrate-binding protein n=1 Tax=Salarchaeum japonicum TaxID=555573 RepID=A0AAV3T3G9_9EURY|nr:ABC transporter substrate-binding protein [Salarchaeum japonicum]